MTIYQELKIYDKELDLWRKAKVTPRGAGIKRDLFRIFKEYDNSVVVSSPNCGSCIPIYMDRLARQYFELKEHYKKRRAGGK